MRDLDLRIYDITMTCDHKMLVVAPTPNAALAWACTEGLAHGSLPEAEPVEIALEPGLLAWYPGPWSADAISEEAWKNGDHA